MTFPFNATRSCCDSPIVITNVAEITTHKAHTANSPIKFCGII